MPSLYAVMKENEYRMSDDLKKLREENKKLKEEMEKVYDFFANFLEEERGVYQEQFDELWNEIITGKRLEY